MFLQVYVYETPVIKIIISDADICFSKLQLNPPSEQGIITIPEMLPTTSSSGTRSRTTRSIGSGTVIVNVTSCEAIPLGEFV